MVVLICISLIISDVEQFWMCCWPSYFLGEISIQAFCPLFNWVVGFFAVKLYKLLAYPRDWALVHCIIWHYFLPFCKLPFFFFISFAVKKLVSLIRSTWFIFAHSSVDLGDWPDKTFVKLMSENVFPMFSSRSLMVSSLWDAAKSVLRGKFIAIQAFLKKKKNLKLTT